MSCESVCFGFQKCLFRKLKQALLACKTIGFANQSHRQGKAQASSIKLNNK